MTEFTVTYPLVVRLNEEPTSRDWPHEIGYIATDGAYWRLDSANDNQLKRMGIVKPTPTLRRGDVLRRRGTSSYLLVNEPSLTHYNDWTDVYDLITHVDLDAEGHR